MCSFVECEVGDEVHAKKRRVIGILVKDEDGEILVFDGERFFDIPDPVELEYLSSPFESNEDLEAYLSMIFSLPEAQKKRSHREKN